MTKQFSVADIRATKPLRDFGIDERQVARFEQRLLLALSGEIRPDSRRFSGALNITSTSTVAEVAAQLTKAYKVSLPAEAGRKHPLRFTDVRKGDAEIAVRTALGQSSRKHSALHITPTMDLGDLGLDQAAINKAKTSIYNVFTGSKGRIRYAEFARAVPTNKSTKVEELVHTSIDAFSLSGTGTIKPRALRESVGGSERTASLSGDRAKGPRGFGVERARALLRNRRKISLSGDRTKGPRG